MTEEIVIHKTADPIKVKLIKGQKDTYGWEISVSGDDTGKIVEEARQINSELRELFKDQLGGS